MTSAAVVRACFWQGPWVGRLKYELAHQHVLYLGGGVAVRSSYHAQGPVRELFGGALLAAFPARFQDIRCGVRPAHALFLLATHAPPCTAVPVSYL
jgi:hypothetical protein